MSRLVRKRVVRDEYQQEGKTTVEEMQNDILAIEEFVRKIGGVERARLALDTLDELRDAA